MIVGLYDALGIIDYNCEIYKFTNGQKYKKTVTLKIKRTVAMVGLPNVANI